jgi:galactokinase
VTVPNGHRFLQMLVAAGISLERATDASRTLAHCDAALDARDASSHGRLSLWTPGRIEVFGKHTDYAGGRSLLTAVERGFVARAAPRPDAQIHVFDPVSGYACETALSMDASAPSGHWSNYVASVARRVARNFPEARAGVDIAFSSDLPVAAGLSSSSALMISVFSALARVNRLHDSDIWRTQLAQPTQLAAYLGAMEHGGAYGDLGGDSGVGTLGGSQDQTAIVCAERGCLVDFGWMPVVRRGAYALPDTHCFVVGASGVVAEKSAGAREQYNRASLMVRHLLTSWNMETGRDDRSLAMAMQSDGTAADTLRRMLSRIATDEFRASDLRKRLDQFLLETYELIPAAADAIARHDWAVFGDVTARSHQAAEDWLGNQVPETMALVRVARAQGAIAASAFGAGFGGSVWALVERHGADAFMQAWRRQYVAQFPDTGARAMFFSTAAGPGAQQWSDDVL